MPQILASTMTQNLAPIMPRNVASTVTQTITQTITQSITQSMTQNLKKIHDRFTESIGVNFSDTWEIIGIVETVNLDQKYFTVRNFDNDSQIECFYKNETIDLVGRENVKIRGWVKEHPFISGKISLAVDYIYLMTDNDKYGKYLENRSKLITALSAEKHARIIRRFVSEPPPKHIYNVGLIVFPNNVQNIENFKAAFQNKCVGNLYIYHIKYSEIETSLKIACEYFKKFNEIDLICLLSNDLDMACNCALSSNKNAVFLLNRKNMPYIVSVTPVLSTNCETGSTEPITNMLSNKLFCGITSCVDYIYQNQELTKTTVNRLIMLGKQSLANIIDKQRKKITDLNYCIVEMSDPSFIQDKKSRLEVLKLSMVQQLNRIKFKYADINSFVMKNIINTHISVINASNALPGIKPSIQLGDQSDVQAHNQLDVQTHNQLDIRVHNPPDIQAHNQLNVQPHNQPDTQAHNQPNSHSGIQIDNRPNSQPGPYAEKIENKKGDNVFGRLSNITVLDGDF